MYRNKPLKGSLHEGASKTKRGGGGWVRNELEREGRPNGTRAGADERCKKTKKKGGIAYKVRARATGRQDKHGVEVERQHGKVRRDNMGKLERGRVSSSCCCDGSRGEARQKPKSDDAGGNETID